MSSAYCFAKSIHTLISNCGSGSAGFEASGSGRSGVSDVSGCCDASGFEGLIGSGSYAGAEADWAELTGFAAGCAGLALFDSCCGFGDSDVFEADGLYFAGICVSFFAVDE